MSVRLSIRIETEENDDPATMEVPFAFSMALPLDVPSAQVLAITLAKTAVSSTGSSPLSMISQE